MNDWVVFFDHDTNRQTRETSPYQFKLPEPSHHDAAKITRRSWAKNINIVAIDWQNVIVDMNVINAGQATRTGNRFSVNNRIYETDDITSTHLYPVSGEGLYALSRAAFKILGLLNDIGDTLEMRQFQ